MTITLALSKGRIFEETLPLLAAAGIEVLEDPEKSRKLILPTNQPDVRVVLADTQVRRALAGSEYNVRRAQCEESARILGVKELRDAVEAARSANRPGVLLLVRTSAGNTPVVLPFAKSE